MANEQHQNNNKKRIRLHQYNQTMTQKQRLNRVLLSEEYYKNERLDEEDQIKTKQQQKKQQHNKTKGQRRKRLQKSETTV